MEKNQKNSRNIICEWSFAVQEQGLRRSLLRGELTVPKCGSNLSIYKQGVRAPIMNYPWMLIICCGRRVPDCDSISIYNLMCHYYADSQNLFPVTHLIFSPHIFLFNTQEIYRNQQAHCFHLHILSTKSLQSGALNYLRYLRCVQISKCIILHSSTSRDCMKGFVGMYYLFRCNIKIKCMIYGWRVKQYCHIRYQETNIASQNLENLYSFQISYYETNYINNENTYKRN